MNKKQKVTEIRWTVSLASKEFAIDHHTLDKALRRSGQEVGADAKYSTKQICAAAFGDHDAEKLRETRERADKLWLENQRTKGEVIERDQVHKFLMQAFAAMKQRILSSSMERDEQDKVLLDLRGLQESPWTVEADKPLAT